MISVICPTYGRIALLEEALQSFLLQSRPDSEMVIVNDLSGVELVFDHPKVRIFNQPNRFPSLGSKRNFCVEQCRGDIIVPLDDDDVMIPGYLDHCEVQLKRRPDIQWYFPFNSLLYHRTEHRMKLTAAMMPNLLVFRRSAWQSAKFPEISFDENGQFLKALIQAGNIGLQRRLPLSEMLYVIGWQPSQSEGYHTQAFYRQNQEGFYSDIESWAKANAPSGKRIVLNPHWTVDYIALRNIFLSTPGVGDAMAMARPKKTAAPSNIRERMSAWAAVNGSWSKAASLMAAIASRGVAATAAAAIGLDPNAGRRIDKATFEIRKSSCFQPCPMLRKANGRRYCGECGCGTNKLALLDAEDGTIEYDGPYVKLHFPELECPLGRPGFSAPKTKVIA